MRCKTCDYPLWNLPARTCPECGAPFSPGEFEFVPNSVRFCCPHCDQSYYGTTPQGHLQPAAFTCVTCGHPVTMDQMVLRPAEGVAEERTRPGRNAWLERDRVGFFKGWMRTIGDALLRPAPLIRATPVESPWSQALRFGVLTLVVTTVLRMIPSLCFMAFLPAFGGAGMPSGGRAVWAMGAGLGWSLAFTLGFLAVFLPLWILSAHGLLRMTGGCGGTLGRTAQAVCYGAGTSAVSIVPCIGGMWFIWWLVSTAVMVKEGHKVHGGRAALAVLALPVICIGLMIAFYVVIFVAMAGAMGGAGGPAMTAPSARGTMVQELLKYRAAQGTWPDHAARLLVDQYVSQWDFVDQSTPTDAASIPVGGVSLTFLDQVDPADQPGYVDDAAAALPADVVAHRVGDFVFTYHGIDPAAADRRLWLVVMSPDPVSAGRGWVTPMRYVGALDGSVRAVPRSAMPAELLQQNRLRAAAGLPPLPDPDTVTHSRPASASRGAP